jgi:hypothetical protein
MTERQLIEEYNKCKESPYYFFKKYVTGLHLLGGEKLATTTLTEAEFNAIFRAKEVVHAGLEKSLAQDFTIKSIAAHFLLLESSLNKLIDDEP